MGEGYRVTPDELVSAASGVQSVLDQLVELAPDRGWAAQGRGVALLGLDASEIGQAEVAGAFVHFCERWEWGVREALRAGREIAEGLDASARHYAAGEQFVGRVMADAVGDPSDPTQLRFETPTDQLGSLASIGDAWSRVVADVGSAMGDPLGTQLDDLARLLGTG